MEQVRYSVSGKLDHQYFKQYYFGLYRIECRRFKMTFTVAPLKRHRVLKGWFDFISDETRQSGQFYVCIYFLFTFELPPRYLCFIHINIEQNIYERAYVILSGIKYFALKTFIR